MHHLLLVAALLFAQLAAGAHAVGHAADNESGLPGHVCELCLAAHDLGATLTSLAALPPIIVAAFVPEAQDPHGRSAFPPPAAPQRGPPSA
ncbi:MAG: hypothetical protein WCA83_01090 [Azonexus sp.]